MKFLHIHCDGGLGRRFNSLVSGIYLAQILQVEYRVSWPINDQCSCSLSDLFEYKFNEFNDYDDSFNFISSYAYYFSDSIKKILNDPFTFKTIDDVIHHVNQSDKNIFFCSYSIPPWVLNTGVYKIINNQLQLKYMIRRYAEQFIKLNKLQIFYGLQLRRTDHWQELDETFFHNLIRHNKNKQFFVTSDEKELEYEFSKLPNVVTHNKSEWVTKIKSDEPWSPHNLHRSKISILDAAVDLLILSRSEILNTNINSNYLKLAVILNGYNNYIREGFPQELRLGMRISAANTPEQQQQILGQQP